MFRGERGSPTPTANTGTPSVPARRPAMAGAGAPALSCPSDSTTVTILITGTNDGPVPRTNFRSVTTDRASDYWGPQGHNSWNGVCCQQTSTMKSGHAHCA